MDGNFEEFGNSLVALGEALKNPSSKMGDVITLANAVGFGVEFVLVARSGEGEGLPPATGSNP